MKFLEFFDQFIFDLDGVLYIGDQITPHAKAVVNELRSHNKTVTFITNNPTKSAKQYSEKLNILGIDAKENEIVTSCQAVNYFLRTEFSNIEEQRVYVAGSDYLKYQIRKTGARMIDAQDCHIADIVIVGSHDEFNYKEIRSASIAVQKGAFFLATNNDRFYPAAEGLLPATGALLASIETVTGRKPVVAGKPGKYIFEYCISADRSRTVIVGDSLDTDILGGRNAGIKTILILTGVTGREDIGISEIVPDYVIGDLSDL